MPDGLEPLPLAMILCDAVHIDPTTGKRTLLGLFSTLVSSEFPTVVRSMAVHVSLTECRGNLAVILQVVDANEDREPIATEEGDVQSDNPLGI